MKQSANLLLSIVIISSFLQTSCVNQNRKLEKMSMKQLSANSKTAAISTEKNSLEIDRLNQEMKSNLAETKVNLEQTKKQRSSLR